MHNGRVVWLTGLSGAGKTTIAKLMYAQLVGSSTPVELLDGDDIREVCPCTGFTKTDRDAQDRKSVV